MAEGEKVLGKENRWVLLVRLMVKLVAQSQVGVWGMCGVAGISLEVKRNTDSGGRRLERF